MKFMYTILLKYPGFCMRNYREPAIGCQEKYGSDPAGGDELLPHIPAELENPFEKGSPSPPFPPRVFIHFC
jgi:hypothetical protein